MIKNHEGGCQCGAVRYVVEGSFAYAGYCHCGQCRHTSGSAFSASAGTKREAPRVTSGRESISTYQKGESTVLSFCKHCGSNLFATRMDTGYVHVRMGTLDEEPGIRPMAHVFVADKAPWFKITDELPQFEGHAPRPSAA